MKVYWTRKALGHLQAIHDYIALDSPHYALKTIDRITYRSIQISGFPFSGRMVPEYKNENVREVIVSPYRLIYRIKEKQIDVLGVFHGSQENIYG